MQHRNVHIFVGDKVETPLGVGFVDEVYTWRDRVIAMRDYEAREFCDECFRDVGPTYRDIWAEVFVFVGGRRQRFLANQIKVLEGRDVQKAGFGAVAEDRPPKERRDARRRRESKGEASAEEVAVAAVNS